MWRIIDANVAGTSHARDNTPCQDASFASEFCAGEGRTYLLVACADGAGTASHSHIGSRLACETAIATVGETLEGGATPVDGIDRAVAARWFARVRDRIEAEAAVLEVPARQLSCTLLVAIVGDDGAAFAQLGDGGLVVRNKADGGPPRLIFWPQNGEYANSTYFVTDPRAGELLMFDQIAHPPSEVAAFTDGIQSLALSSATRSAHPAFFAPFFDGLTAASTPSDLRVPLIEFLNSPSVNARTDDDKTFVVAVKEPPRVE